MIFKLIKTFFVLAGISAIALFYLKIWSFWPVILIILIYLILVLILATNVQLNFFVRAFNKNPEFSENVVALSFDDGPDENTLKILDILDRHHAKAIFFCIGRKIEKHPEIFREIIKRGHIVGNHTFSHTRKMGFLSSKTILNEIWECDRIAKEVGKVKMNLFRPPFGIINPKTQRALKQTGHQVIGWNIRPYDAITRSPERILKRIIKKVGRGDVILLHDNMPNTAPILEQLLVILKQRKIGIVRADKLFDIHAYN